MSVGPIDAGMPRVALLQPRDSFEITGDVDSAKGSIGTTAAQPSFGNLLLEAVGQAAELGHVANDKAAAFARGAHDDLHGTMIASKEAEISVKLVGTIRTKLLESFQELWRINV